MHCSYLRKCPRHANGPYPMDMQVQPLVVNVSAVLCISPNLDVYPVYKPEPVFHWNGLSVFALRCLFPPHNRWRRIIRFCRHEGCFPSYTLERKEKGIKIYCKSSNPSSLIDGIHHVCFLPFSGDTQLRCICSVFPIKERQGLSQTPPIGF